MCIHEDCRYNRKGCILSPREVINLCPYDADIN